MSENLHQKIGADRERLRELAEKATPGKWTACMPEDIWPTDVVEVAACGFPSSPSVCADAPITSGELSESAERANAEFIAEARTAIPALLTALDEAEEALAEVTPAFIAIDTLSRAFLSRGATNHGHREIVDVISSTAPIVVDALAILRGESDFEPTTQTNKDGQ